jgi:hypothetical protein
MGFCDELASAPSGTGDEQYRCTVPTRVRVQLARTRLLYGEGLRRERRSWMADSGGSQQ